MTSSSPSVVEALEGALEWRCIGPYRAGRVIAVAGDPVDPRVFYFGSVGGGVWKSTDGGAYWQNASDGFLNTASVGAIAVAQSDPNVVYAGMGETCIRIDLTHGDGVYRSDDAGATWTHLGLEDTRHISRVRVHPGDPDLVYVAAFGHAFGPSGQRGIFRSKDGGRSWQNILYESDGRRRGRPVDGSQQPAHTLRLHVGGPALILGDEQRRPRQRPLPLHRRRRHLG